MGVTLSNETPSPKKAIEESEPAQKVKFPVAIQAIHNKQTYSAELLDIKGLVRFGGQEHPTPTTAAKVVVKDWKEVNGWDFWRYYDKEAGKWLKIGTLR